MLTDSQKLNFEVAVYGTIAALGGVAQSTVTLLHYIRGSTATAYSASELITAFHNACKADWKAAVSVSWNWDKTSVRCINSPAESAVEATVNEAGSVTGDMLPAFNACVLSKKTGLRGRSYNGRLYIPGIAESSTTGNALTSGAKTLFDALAVKLSGVLTTAAGLAYTPAVLSRVKSNLTTDPSTIVMTPITSVVTRSVLGRQIPRRSPTS